jgi:hypothetical protein
VTPIEYEAVLTFLAGHVASLAAANDPPTQERLDAIERLQEVCEVINAARHREAVL